MRIVDQVPSPHRVRFADVDGSGRKALLVAPILNPRSQPVGSNDPDHLPTALYAYRAPGWKRELVSEENRGPVHGVEIYDWNGDGREETITSGQSGIYAHGLGKDGKWQRIQVAPGNPAPWPDNGASDVDVGRLGGKQFFVAIEPFHGNLLVVYTQDAQGNYRRNVIDNGLIRGHGVTLADFDRDGVPEIVAGGAGSANNLFFYRATDPGGQHWTKQLMDNELATDDCVTAHIKGDRKITDVICISGRAPNDVKWFEYVRR
jgi:hypothetical protein